MDLQWSVLERSLRAVAPRARGRLLDVGCGNKPYEAWFRPFVSAYLGVEHAATFARTEAGAHAGPDVVYGGGTLPFRDGSFDTVLSVQVLEHTPRPAALVAEMARVLAPDGILILTAPFQFRLHEQPHDYFRYSAHGLRQLCDDAGLEVFETIAQGSLWSVVGHKLNSYLALRVARVGQLAQRWASCRTRRRRAKACAGGRCPSSVPASCRSPPPPASSTAWRRPEDRGGQGRSARSWSAAA